MILDHQPNGDCITDSTWHTGQCEIVGTLYVDYDESGRYDDRSGETYLTDVRSVEIMYLHLEGMCALSRNELVALVGKTAVNNVELSLLEDRLEMVG